MGSIQRRIRLKQGEKMKDISLAIKNLENASHVLEKMANSEENYNATYSGYLENISWEMHKYANDLREIYRINSEYNTQCTCVRGCIKCLDMAWKDFY